MTKLKITNEKELQANIKRLEGGFRSDVHMVPSKIKDTDETVDIPHIGYGFKIDEKDYAFYNLLEDGTQDPNKPAYKMDKNVAEKRFLKEYNKAHKAAKNLAKEKGITKFERIAAFTDLAYNMGTEWHLKFPNAMKALDSGDYLEFTKELLRGKDRYTKSAYVNDVGIDRVTQNTLPFGYDHTVDYNSGLLYQYQSDVPETKSFMGTDYNLRLKEEPGRTPRLTGDVSAYAENSLGSGFISVDDHKNVYGKASVKSPVGTFSTDTDKNNTFAAEPFNIGNVTIDAQTSSRSGPSVNIGNQNFNLTASEEYVLLNIDKLSAKLDPYQISAEYNVDPNFVIGIQKNFQGDGDVSVGFDKSTNFLGGNLSYGASQTSGGESKAGFNFRKTFEEGGEVEQPSLTSQVLPNETVQPTGFVDRPQQVDTSEGFYKYNPAPNESAADFAARMPNEQPVQTLVADDSSFRPPEDYVSPRTSTSLVGSSNITSSTGSDTTTTSTNFPKQPSGNLSASQQAAINLLGTTEDVLASGSFDKKTFDPLNNQAVSDIVTDWTDTLTEDLYKSVEDLSYVHPLLNKDRSLTDIINDINNVELDTTVTFGQELLRNPDGSLTRDVNGKAILTKGTTFDILEEYTGNNTGINQKLLSDTTLKTILEPADNESWFEKLGDTHLGEISNTSIEIKDLYDEFGAAAFTYFITEDSGKALTAGATQFVKTEGVRIIADNIGDAAFKLHSPKINAMTSNAEINAYLKAETGLDYNLSGDLNASKDAANQALRGKASSNFTTYATGAAAMLQTLAMGGTAEDAILAGAESVAITLGAEPLGELMGFQAGPDVVFGDPTAVGGAAISALVAFARTGNVEQAAISGGTSYLMHINPVLGFIAMGAQLAFAPEAKNYAGYTSLNLNDMTTKSFSQGDVDPSKASPENVKYTAQGIDTVIPVLEDIKEKYNITEIIGDLEIQYGDRDGLFLTITEDKDITGLTQRADFNEEEGDLDRNQVYQKKFDNIQQLQQHVIELFEWAATNMVEDGILDLSTLLQKRKEKMNETLLASLGSGYSSVGSLMNDPRGGNYETGGKILDKTSKLLYNSNQAKNYGLVDKKGKAPPSMRADDVPMNLNEGDFVLSQPAVNLYGKDTIERMVNRASKEAGTNLKSGGKVPVNVHNGEYIIPKNLTKYIGSNVLENMNNRGLMSVGDKTNI